MTHDASRTQRRFHLTLIALIAALMGIGQNGLLVSLPFLVEHSAFGLPTWSIVIAIGSFLFLPSAPFWGSFSDRNGPKTVVLQALAGMAVSFLLLLIFTALSNEFSEQTYLWLAGLIVARIIYGCTVAGMVPASQHWAILLCGEGNRLQAITSVSIGLSTGRLIGPLLAMGALQLHTYAPLMLMVAFPVIALLGACWLPKPAFTPKADSEKTSPPGKSRKLPEMTLLPFLLTGLLLCTVVALLQYSLSPLIESITMWATDDISQAIGLLLTLSAAFTLLTQVLVIKKKKLDIDTMYRLGGFALLAGFVLFLNSAFWVFTIAMVVVSVGAALLVPAYTSMATQTNPEKPGKIAGLISMSHTLGYGLASLLASTAVIFPQLPVWVCIGFAVLVAGIAFTRRKEKEAVSVV
ncbi:MFS transporter [Photobacterium sp. WH24]|uniref:MFS transporter n=1 Tax=Photobacterium arenosum TaxID=2774143 RepID=A0ABR9BN38_9GAMM|nr:MULTISPECIES: MFS transporter [Photobacterium]MBD8513963.1 MFS transporter [Photobacterium arenosum]MBV7262409.1 MFS transporter [Photobacterium sp. WH24]